MNKPVDIDQRRRAMLQRVEKLESQAKRLLAEAEKARARYEALAKLGDDVTIADLGEDDAEDDLGMSAALESADGGKKAAGSDDSDDDKEDAASLHDTAMNESVAQDQRESEDLSRGTLGNGDAQDLEEGSKKKSKKDKKRLKKEKKATDTETNFSESADLTVESKERDEPMEAAVDEKVPSGKKHKKSKSKGKQLEEDVAIEPVKESDIPKSDDKSEKKSKKDKKRKRDSEAAVEPLIEPTTEVTSEDALSSKKSKKNKRKSAGADDKEQAPVEETKPVAEAAAAWNVGALDGGAARQAKFMRLLGGKKATATASAATSAGGRPHFDIGAVTNQLEQQFEAGRRMKFDMGGQRKGLGA